MNRSERTAFKMAACVVCVSVVGNGEGVAVEAVRGQQDDLRLQLAQPDVLPASERLRARRHPRRLQHVADWSHQPRL